ncbi:MAG: shikimate dehydrogenase [Bacteroidetes bacterium]|nr:MAG: shikimate dehydrogenase [Bacteroidota bacterium]
MVTRLFGLIGFPLSHSFSKKYFAEKFAREGLVHCAYELFPLERIEDFPALLRRYPELAGLNVTIPHKTAVIPYLDELDEEAAQVGAVNTIAIREGHTRGYNTDVYGFRQSLLEFLPRPQGRGALVLGTGGAARAVAHVLRQLGLAFRFVSRSPGKDRLTYEALRPEHLKTADLIVNTTPLGMSPNVDSCPALPWEAIGPQHYLYDLVYNPAQTRFLQRGAQQGAHTLNGLRMLHLQAEKAWEIWK